MQAKKKNAKMTVKKGKNRARVPAKQMTASPKKIEKKTDSEKKPKAGKTLLIAQEVKFARLLANNDKKVRDKVLKNLKKWLMVRSRSSFAFTEADFMRLWKGLFYCMWMSDKPLVQEELAESLSNLVHCFSSMDTALLYTKCTLKSLAAEWFGIDRFRIDKFEMLVRKIIRQTFEMCRKQYWDKQWIIGVGKVVEDILLDPKTCLGLNLHITDVYMEELAKISEGNIPKNIVTEFVRPFIIHLAGMNDERQIKHVVKNIFRYLIFQSDVGMDYTDKFNAWREAGFPCEHIDDMQKIEISDDENEEDDDESEEETGGDESSSKTKGKPLDPRAGRVDVEIPQIPFDPAEIARVLKENKFHKSSTTKTRKHITRLINDFTKLVEGDMPFGIKEIPLPETTRMNSYEAAEELLNFNNELYSDSSKNNRKRKKNGDLTELDLDTDNIEELVPPQNHDNLEMMSSSNKKQKLIKSDVVSKKNINRTDENLEDKKVIKQKKKEKLSMKKKSKRLNVSEPLPKKKLKKSSKKLNNTVAVFTEESKPVLPVDANASKEGTSSNWNVDISVISTLTSATPEKVLKKKKAPMKKEVSNEEVDTDLLKSNIPWLTPVLTRLEEQNKTPTSPKSTPKPAPETNSAKKRVKIVLQRNMAQNTSEYIRQIRQSPAIPYDANRKPKAGVLKPSPLPSPVNPFYKKKIF